MRASNMRKLRRTSTFGAGDMSSRAFRDLLRDVQRFPLLSEEETRRLAQHPRERGANEKLVQHNMRLVLTMASAAFGARTGHLQELVACGALGLIRGVGSYDPGRGFKLTTYVAWWIKASMHRYIAANVSIVAAGHTAGQRKAFNRLNAVTSQLEAKGVEATDEALAAALSAEGKTEVSAEDVRYSANALSGDPSLNANASGHSGGTFGTWQDRTPAHGTPVDEMLGELEERAGAARVIAKVRRGLTPRERLIFDARIGDEANRRTLADVGRQLGMSRERARQLEVKLRERLLEEGRRFFGLEGGPSNDTRHTMKSA